MAITWPAHIKPVKIEFAPVRISQSFSTPISGDESENKSPYAKVELTAYFKPLRAGAQGGWDAVAAILSAEDDLLRFPFKIAGRARGSASLVAVGSNNKLTITAAGGGDSKPLVNGGAGFKTGQPVSVTVAGVNYCYFVAADQINNDVFVKSRMRSGNFASAQPLAYDPAYVEGRLSEESKRLTWDEANFFEWSITIREPK